jgi:hypothetical protein
LDNWFTSITLAEVLWTKKLTILGTLRSNRKGIPEEAKESKKREVKSVMYFYRQNMMLASYKDKGSGNVLLLSTEHHRGYMTDGKPNVVITYNQTKSGVDNLDHMVRLYSSKRKCKRWPYEMAFNLFDVAAVNAYILMHNNNPTKRNNERYHFLLNLGYALVEPHILERQQHGPLTFLIKEAMASSGFPCNVVPFNQENAAKRGRCVMCPRQADKKVNDRCSDCFHFVCKQHSSFVCNQCKTN